MKKIFISFITPIHNVNKYLDDLFSSFKNISKDVYEIIAVDDRGQEDPAQYIEKWKETLNIKYIKNKLNQGISTSRNNGLKHVSKKTTHVIFIDSDDALYSQDFISEIVFGKITYFNEYIWTPSGLKYNNLNKHFGTSRFHGSIPGKAYPIEIAKNILHDPDVKTYEDILTSRRISKKYEDLIILSKTPLIKYRQRSSSITNSELTPSKFRDMSDQWIKLVDENLINYTYAHYELRQRYWIWRKYLRGNANLPKTKWWIKFLAFLGGNAIRIFFLKKVVYGKKTKDVFE